MQWCKAEAKRRGVRPMTIVHRVRNGFYVGMKLFRKNARRVFVISAGRCRAALKKGCKPGCKNARTIHFAAEPKPTNGKYLEWMTFFDCGGMRPRVDEVC